MKSNKFVVSAMFIFFTAIVLQSCSDDSAPVNSSTINVTGKLTGSFAQFIPGKQVKIDNQTSITSSDGSFSFSNVTAPYNVIITDSTSDYLFTNISSGDIRIPDYTIFDNVQTATITITYPPEIIQPGLHIKAMYTDGNYINSYGDYSPVSVNLPDNSPVTGKLYVMTYKKNSKGKIISYENFGISAPFEISAGQAKTYNFTLEELSFNPEEGNVNVRFSPPANYISSNQYLTFTFSKKRTRNYSIPIQFESFIENEFTMKIPANLPVEYTTIIGNYVYDNSNSVRNNIESFVIPSNTSSVTLINKIPPLLLTPADNATGVTSTTQFTYSQESGNGVYVIRLQNMSTVKVYTLITESTSFTLSDFAELNLGNISSTQFSWNIEKIGNANSVNEYLTIYTNSQNTFRANSESRRFTSAQ